MRIGVVLVSASEADVGEASHHNNIPREPLPGSSLCPPSSCLRFGTFRIAK